MEKVITIKEWLVNVVQSNKINVVGLGPGNIKYLSTAGIDCIKQAEIIIGSTRQLSDLKTIISEKQEIYILGKLTELIAYLKENIDEYFSEIDYEFDDDDKSNLELSTVFDYDGNFKDNVILVKVPTTKPYEVLAYFGMGGYNECPFPAEQVAVAKYWYEKYGAVPAVITDDTIVFYVERPVQTLEEAKNLAVEHYIFCYDIVAQCYGTFEKLVDALYKNIQWYFWWD